MAIAKNANSRIKTALGRTLLGLSLQLAPAQMQKVQDAVEGAALQLVQKETSGAKGRYDLPRALDRFGQTRETGAPEIDTIAPEKLLSERGEPGGETKKTPQAAREAAQAETPEPVTGEAASFQPFPEQTPQEQAAGPEAERAKRPTEGGQGAPEAEGEATPEGEQAPPEAAEPEIQERGGLTQKINDLRYSNELKKIDKQLKELNRRQTLMNRKIRQLKLKIAPLELAKKALQSTKALFLIAAAILAIIGIILCVLIITIEAGLPVLGAAGRVYAARKKLDKPIQALDKTMKPFKDKIKQMEILLQKITKQVKLLARRALELRNASLFERKASGGGSAPALAA